MHAIEFTTDLSDEPILRVPREVASQLPHTGKAKVIVLTEESGSDDGSWRAAAYEQFMRDEAPEDAVYDDMA